MSGEKVGEINQLKKPVYLGVDGGKSKTLCLVSDASGHVLGCGKSGSSDKYYVSLDQALDEIQKAVLQACQTSQVEKNQIKAGVFGLAGADWNEDFDELAGGLQRLGLIGQVLVKNDVHIALRASVHEGPGVLISAGTHLACAIRLPDGKEWHSGWFSVDGAGGVYAGKQLFWAVMRAEDSRGKPTVLTRLLLDYSNVKSPIDLLRNLSTGALGDTYFASLTPMLFDAHLEYGDEVAAHIIEAIGRDIALWAIGLMERYGLFNMPIPVILSGGLFKTADPLLFDTVAQSIHKRLPHAVVRLASCEPVVGALYYAFELDGLPLTPDRVCKVEATASEFTRR